MLSALAGGASLVWWKSASPDPEPHTEQVEEPVAIAPPEDKPIRVATKPSLNQSYCGDPFQATCNTSWPSADPTGYVRPDVTGEIRALRVMRRLMRENPTWTAEQVQESLGESIYTEERRARVQNAFAWVVSELRSFLESQTDAVLSEEEKANLIRQVGRISLELPPPVSVYADAADIITKNTVYYERTPRDTLRLRMGGAYLLTSSSWYNIVYTFAHEVAHSIDPCEAKYAGIWPRTYDKLISCFVDSGWVQKDRAECGPNEQISEVFADWIASELISRALGEFGKEYSSQDKTKSVINAVRDLCEQPVGESLDFRQHQEPDIRIGSILGKNPSVRAGLGCTPLKKHRYCRFE